MPRFALMVSNSLWFLPSFPSSELKSPRYLGFFKYQLSVKLVSKVAIPQGYRITKTSINIQHQHHKLTGWWFGTFFIFHFIYGLSSFPLTNSYFSRWLKPPTSWDVDHLYQLKSSFSAVPAAFEVGPPTSISLTMEALQPVGGFQPWKWCLNMVARDIHGDLIGD